MADHSESSTKAKEEGQNYSTFTDSIWEEMKKLENWVPQNSNDGEPKMLRVPHWLRNTREHLYEPSLLSIGPYNWTNPDGVKRMEHDKWLCANILFTNKSMLDKCVKKLNELEVHARSCYPKDDIKDISSEQFVKIMLLDCCFIIMVFVCNTEGFSSSNHFEDDFSKSGVFKMRYGLWYELFLLENQVPLFLLRTILRFCERKYFDALKSQHWFASTFNEILKPENEKEAGFQNLLHIFYHDIIRLPNLNNDENSIKLSCCDYNLHCSFKITKIRPTFPKPHRPFHSATKLQDKGVKFKGVDDNFKNITFSKNGTLEVPCIIVDDLEMMNMLAFEQTNYDKNLARREFYSEDGEIDNLNSVFLRTPLSNVMYFVASMITTTKDLEILEECGVVEKGSKASNKDTVRFFGLLRGELQLGDDYDVYVIRQEIDEFIKSKRNEWWVKLKEDYFSNPWRVISLLGATLFLVLAFLQTYYTMYPLPHKKS